MTLPNFREDGTLPPGVYEITGKEFVGSFCVGDQRKKFRTAVIDIFDFATGSGAIDLLIGGSFITDKLFPNDLDCVVIYGSEKKIPEQRKSVVIDGAEVDIFFCAIDQKEILASFVKLFSYDKTGKNVGCIVVHLRSEAKLLWDVHHAPHENVFRRVKDDYVQSHIVNRQPREKVLVTIHGIRTQAEWNSEVSLIASMNGWVVAPFQYGFVDVDVFLDRKQRNEIVDRFRAFVFELKHSFDLENISIIAHSFGTYIVVRYLLGFDDPPVQFDTVILCGAIVDHKLDLERFQRRAATICNEVAPNDEWASWAKRSNFGQDEFFGNAATLGFEIHTPRLIQRRADIFTHNNVIRRDVVVQRWMPVLEANVGAIKRERRSS